MKLRGFDITKSQRGWVSDCYFMETTASQFTDVEFSTRSGSSWAIVAFIKSYFAARRLAAIVRSKPGERMAKGWTE